MLLIFNEKLNDLNIRCCLLRKISTQLGKNVAYFSKREYVTWEKRCSFYIKVRNLGKMLHVLQERYTSLDRRCMFYRKGTQVGKDVARFVERLCKMGKALHVLQVRYARWERCCMFCKKSTQGGKDVACLTYN
jgi:hypothetical protein